jgi:hypothetical protein
MLFRPFLAVFTAPVFDLCSCVQTAGKPVLTEAFVAWPSVEGFDSGGLVRLAGLDKPQLHATVVSLCDHGLATELILIIASNHLRRAVRDRQAVHYTRHADAGDGSPDFDGDSLMRRVVDDRRAFDNSAFGGAIKHEVNGPNLVRGQRASQRLPFGRRDSLSLAPPPLHCRPSVRRPA